MNEAIKLDVWRRDRWRCQYCGVRLVRFAEGGDGDDMATVDHVTPKDLGGSDAVANLVAACKRCNEGKGARLPATYRSAEDWATMAERARALAREIVAAEFTTAKTT